VGTREYDLVYLVAGHPLPYPQPHLTREGFISWLDELGTPPTAITTHTELNQWLDSSITMDGGGSGGCDLLYIHDDEQCPLTAAMAPVGEVVNGRVGSEEGVPRTLAQIRRPMVRELEVVLAWRLPHLSASCPILVLIAGDRFIELPSMAAYSTAAEVSVVEGWHL